MFDNNTIVFNENKSIEDERRYAYEKAIEAYWKHVDRYHTWMNYYAIFNGALFVGFCTLLTSTSLIKFDSFPIITLSNNSMILCTIICTLGLIASTSWLLSILGHESWERNWMNIIEKYETKSVYKLLRLKETDIIEINGRKYFKAISTHKITTIFVCFIMVGWIISPLFLLLKDVSWTSWIITILLFLELILTGYIIMLIYNMVEFIPLYSNCEDKIIEKKQI